MTAEAADDLRSSRAISGPASKSTNVVVEVPRPIDHVTDKGNTVRKFVRRVARLTIFVPPS